MVQSRRTPESSSKNPLLGWGLAWPPFIDRLTKVVSTPKIGDRVDHGRRCWNEPRAIPRVIAFRKAAGSFIRPVARLIVRHDTASGILDRQGIHILDDPNRPTRNV